MISEEVREYLKGVEGVVEATRFEQHALWEHFSRQAHDAGFGRKAPTILYDWKSLGHGFIPQVGTIDGKPIVISLLIDIVDGYRVLFYHCSGTYADHDQIEQWLRDNVAAYNDRDCRTDATNFTNLMGEYRGMKKFSRVA